jgi:L-threonylcarbamoyladenylate synthase
MVLQIKIQDLNASTLKHVANVLENDGVVCFPTDTVYGLAVNPRSTRAVDRLFELKGRASEKPILLLLSSLSMARSVAQPNAVFERIAERFWPGPLTLVTHAGEGVLDRLTAGTGTLGLRWPEASVPLRLIDAFGGPITGTSANRSGQPVAKTPDEILEQLGESLDLIIDGGCLDTLLASTVVDVTGETPTLVREGALPYEALANFLEGGVGRTA